MDDDINPTSGSGVKKCVDLIRDVSHEHGNQHQ